MTRPAAPAEPAEPAEPPAALLPGDDAGVEMVAKFFRALGDPTRLRLLAYLLDGEHTVTECVAHIGLSQGRISTHLGCLADCSYVHTRRHGRYVYYRVADPRVADLVVLARSLAADNAAALAACIRIDTPDRVTPPRRTSDPADPVEEAPSREPDAIT